MKWLETAYAEGHPERVFSTNNAALETLSGDARFVVLLKRIGLDGQHDDPVDSHRGVSSL